MKLEHIIEARLAQQWEPKPLTRQWLETVKNPTDVEHWKQSKKHDYSEYLRWIQRHEDDLNWIYEEIVFGWKEFKRATQPRKIPFGDHGEFELEHDWDINEFKIYDQFNESRVYQNLIKEDDFDDEWFETVIDQMWDGVR